MKNVIIFVVIFASFCAFTKEPDVCNIQVRVHGGPKDFKESKKWLGSYKLGFEVRGVLKLQPLKFGQTKTFQVPCEQTYVLIHFDYITHPVVGELDIYMTYKDKQSKLTIKTENCETIDKDAHTVVKRYCSGTKERLVDNIAIR